MKLDDALGVHAHALRLYSKRAEVIASNMANADTPRYKARDLDFKATLQSIEKQAATTPGVLKTTHSKHISNQSFEGVRKGAELLYRVPEQPSLDGNSVDMHVEQSEFAQNTVRYQASFTFVNGKIKGLMNAIKGE